MSGYRWPHDPEVPVGFQDADIEQAEMERQGARLSALRKQGICVHGWRRGTVDGQAKCLDCGKVATVEELDDERERHGFGRMGP